MTGRGFLTTTQHDDVKETTMTDTTTTFNVTTSDGPDQTDPRAIDWAARQARAVVPFDVVDGLPVHPLAGELGPLPAGRGGLWHWGEATASDAIVTASDEHGVRRLLMVRRSDGHGWALPGGCLDEGESARAACVRELAEETGLTLREGAVEMLPGRIVPDPRQGRNAWMVTIPGRVDLGTGLPQVTGQDDATDAAWITATSFPALHAALAVRGGLLFPAHRALLRDALS